MMTIHLAYSPINKDLADRIDHNLQRAGLQFKHLTPPQHEPAGTFASMLQTIGEPVVLLITDNFLKDEQCMSGLLSTMGIVKNRKDLQVVIADGKESKDGGHSWIPVATEYERMVHALRYMNYWQDIYLNLIEDVQQAEPGADKEEKVARMEAVKDISSEVGNFLNLLREIEVAQWPVFSNNHYHHFFQHFNLLDRFDAYANLPELETTATPQPSHPTPAIDAESPTESSTPVEAPGQEPTGKKEDSPAPTVHIPGPLAPQKAPEDPLLAPIVPEDEEYDDEAIPLDPEQAEIDDKPFRVEEAVDTTTPPADQGVYSKEETDQVVRDAHFWLDRNHIERGLDIYRQALEHTPHNKDLRTAFLYALLEFGHDPDAANNQLEVLHSQGLPEIRSYELMGDIALERGDHLFAKYCWDRVAELQKDYPGIFRKLGLLTSEHLSEYKETAIHYLRMAIERKEANPRVYHRLAALLWENGEDLDGALELLKTTTTLKPDWAEAWLDLADANRHMKQYEEAATAYQKAIALDPELQSKERDESFTLPSEPEPEPHPLPIEEENIETTTAETQPVGEQAMPDRPQVLTVMITGASSGIGRATADLFASKGHRVILIGRREDRLNSLKEQFAASYKNEAVHTIPLDVRDQKAVKEALSELPEAWEEIDVLINNAGLAKGLAPIHEGSLEHWDTMIDTNIKGLLYVTRYISPGMVKRKKGHIINTGSSAGKEVYKNGNVYCATKFAVNALTQGMRLDLHEHNIRVSQVSPGHVEETEFALTRFDGDRDKARIYEDFQPLKASDVAEAIYFMATRPPHVNVQDLWMFSTQQAASAVIDRSGRV